MMTEHTPHQILQSYFAAMRQGSSAEDDLMALFTDDAVYEEPFTGSPDPAVGLEAIRERLRFGWSTPLPEMQLDVLAIDVTGDRAQSRWECRSPAFPTPVRGSDTYEFRDGLIAVLRVTIDEPNSP